MLEVTRITESTIWSENWSGEREKLILREIIDLGEGSGENATISNDQRSKAKQVRNMIKGSKQWPNDHTEQLSNDDAKYLEWISQMWCNCYKCTSWVNALFIKDE